MPLPSGLPLKKFRWPWQISAVSRLVVQIVSVDHLSGMLADDKPMRSFHINLSMNPAGFDACLSHHMSCFGALALAGTKQAKQTVKAWFCRF